MIGLGKARSYRLTKENEIRFEQIKKLLRVDNPNRAFNAVIENYHEFMKLKPIIDAIKVIKEELK